MVLAMSNNSSYNVKNSMKISKVCNLKILGFFLIKMVENKDKKISIFTNNSFYEENAYWKTSIKYF